MKKMIFTLVAILTMAALPSDAMTYEQARGEALFLTDKMAYELNLSDAQYEAAYEINLDYLMSVTGYSDVGGLCWERRNADLHHILYSWQWDAFCAAAYFYRPLYWEGGFWHFGVYARYPRRDYFFFGRPHFYASYRGGHSWFSNGGHSFYEHRRDMFRPGHVERDSHVGMRNSFDRGDYRRVPHGNSSTRVTAGEGRGHNGYRGGNSSNGYRDNGSNGYRGDGGSGRDNHGSNVNGGRNGGGSSVTGGRNGGGSSVTGGRNGGGSSVTGGRNGGGSSVSGGAHRSSAGGGRGSATGNSQRGGRGK